MEECKVLSGIENHKIEMMIDRWGSQYMFILYIYCIVLPPANVHQS